MRDGYLWLSFQAKGGRGGKGGEEQGFLLEVCVCVGGLRALPFDETSLLFRFSPNTLSHLDIPEGGL